MGDILKEAIADAKAVRETALENAKMALEEAFTPQLKSMLSAKLKEDEEGHEDEPEETYEDEEMGDEEVPAEEAEEFGDDEEEVEESTEAVSEGEEDDEDEVEEGEHHDDEEVEEENLDLEAVIKELESELAEQDDAYDETADHSNKNGGNGDLAEQDDAYDETADHSNKNGGNGDLAEGEGDDEEEPVEEEYEIDESALFEEEEEEVEESNTSTLQAELKEYKEAVHFLKDKLHEVNILNAKLLFTNKLFKQYSLDNNQKLKVVETFDRAQTTREIKLVYSTLAEQFNDNSTIVTRKSIKESASAPVSSTKPSKESKKVITEESQVADRFKKLAGIIK
jgi:hypothetical protein